MKVVLSAQEQLLRKFLPAGFPTDHGAFSYYPRLQRVRGYVEDHYPEDIPLETAARIAGLERKYFSIYFRSKVGMGFPEWVTSVRIVKAMRLIMAKDQSLSIIPLRIGFKEPRTFQRAFKRVTGISPRDFKRIVRPS